ncbi:hypothetical protein EIKCOROL_00724 [Eikenella corrodens ATCC 23834]|uniref:Uncharacterized protein n=1 Tax=Eikenella corrodens ATCC 23834 TaxID=546274 RepID=C0DTP3_EIKCO|nr:hypothetical protein EIKCOROL_00724 [Eikenella corrodens ATCC 23834]
MIRFSGSLHHTQGYLKTLLQEIQAQPDLFIQVVHFLLGFVHFLFQLADAFQIAGVVALVAVAHFTAFFQILLGLAQAFVGSLALAFANGRLGSGGGRLSGSGAAVARIAGRGAHGSGIGGHTAEIDGAAVGAGAGGVGAAALAVSAFVGGGAGYGAEAQQAGGENGG